MLRWPHRKTAVRINGSNDSEPYVPGSGNTLQPSEFSSIQENLPQTGLWGGTLGGPRGRAGGGAPQGQCKLSPTGVCPGFLSRPIWTNSCCSLLNVLTGGIHGAVSGRPSQQSLWWEMQRSKAQTEKPNTCQALSHSGAARRPIKMSLSLSCRWLYYPLRWLLVIKKKKKQISFFFFALLWPSPGLFQTIID